MREFVAMLGHDVLEELALGPLPDSNPGEKDYRGKDCRACQSLEWAKGEEDHESDSVAARALLDWHDVVTRGCPILGAAGPIQMEVDSDLEGEINEVIGSFSYARCCVIYSMAESELRGRDLRKIDPRHIVEFRRDGWSLSHPVGCRIEGKSLLDCEINRELERIVGENEGPPPSVRSLGRYIVESDGVELTFEVLPPTG